MTEPALLTGVIIVVPTSTADYNQFIVTDQWDDELAKYIIINPGVAVPPEDTAPVDVPSVGVWAKAHLEQLSSLPEVDDEQVLNRRTLPSVWMDISAPANVQGQPMSPKYWATNDSSVTARTDPGHLDGIDDPNPIWDPVHSRWIVEPPDGGVGDIRWTVFSLPDPVDYGGVYPLGTGSSKDNSNFLPSEAKAWDPDSSTPAGFSWKSSYPFKPNVTSYDHLNNDGTIHTATRGVMFHSHFIQHMWGQMSSPANMPFTWIIVALVLNHGDSQYRHHLLDSGKSPYHYYSNFNIDNLPNDRDLPGNHEGLKSRNLLAVDRDYAYMSGDWNTTVRCGNYHIAKPKMYWGIWDGDNFPHTRNSYVGAWSHELKPFFRAHIPADPGSGNHTFHLLGRKNGSLGSDDAANMLVFEIRFWRRALVPSELHAQFAQLASTWKFSRYQ